MIRQLLHFPVFFIFSRVNISKVVNAIIGGTCTYKYLINSKHNVISMRNIRTLNFWRSKNCWYLNYYDFVSLPGLILKSQNAFIHFILKCFLQWERHFSSWKYYKLHCSKLKTSCHDIMIHHCLQDWSFEY